MLLDYPNMVKYKVWNGISGPIFHSDKMTIAHLEIEAGTELPMHQHYHEQWSNLIEGEFEFIINGEVYSLKPGMSVHMPPDVPHSGRAITNCKIIDCFHPVRQDWKALEII
jgi:quercetin dioxygenase-like cupin family protein